ncbi:MAG: hypothetical protein H7333_10945 [Bdellovibrionales bacterium]|nr:hypothetical protein [Oligoflexia bacterium]
MKKIEITENEFVIQGIIKEAFFNEVAFQFKQDEISLTLKIADLIEGKIRDSSENKKICFSGTPTHPFKKNFPYEFKANFRRFTITGSLKFVHDLDGLYVFHFPIELQLENLRKADRTKVGEAEARPVPTFLRSHSLHCEGSFILEDTSGQGYGGILRVPSQFPIEPGTTVTGKLGFSHEIGQLNGIIVSAALGEDKQQGFDSYRVGINQLQKLNSEPLVHRRKQQRHKTAVQLNLESLLHPGQILTLNVDDISVNGFSGLPGSGSIISNVPLGSGFKLFGENTRARLVNFSKDRLHFQVISRSEVEGVAWLKRMTPFIYPGARCSSKDARELYRIFFQAGAVSNQYLKRHKLHSNILVDDATSNLSDNAYIHRWFVGGTHSEADAYVSAIRLSNSCWVLGDIAKANGTETNAKDAVKSFFQSFSEYAIGSPGIGTQMIFWVKDHPMWASWHRKLQTAFKELICCEMKMQYFRIGSTAEPIDDDIQNTVIGKEDYSLRLDILKQLSDAQNKLLDFAFDFNEQGTGSFVLKEVSKTFERIYSVVETATGKYLAITNQVQLGLSVNRFADSLFVVPLFKLGAGDGCEREASQIANKLSIDLGIVFPSVRVLYEGPSMSEGTEMTCLLLYPRAFLEFE